MNNRLYLMVNYQLFMAKLCFLLPMAVFNTNLLALVLIKHHQFNTINVNIDLLKLYINYNLTLPPPDPKSFPLGLQAVAGSQGLAASQGLGSATNGHRRGGRMKGGLCMTQRCSLLRLTPWMKLNPGFIFFFALKKK